MRGARGLYLCLCIALGLPWLCSGATVAAQPQVAPTWPATISGKVLNGTTPVAGVTPSVQAVSPVEIGTTHVGTCAYQFSGPTAADGSFTLYASACRYDLYLGNAPGGDSAVPMGELFVDASAGGVFSNQTLGVVNPSNRLSGAVTDTITGQPLSGVVVSTALISSSQTPLVVASATTDDTGHYSVLMAPAYHYIALTQDRGPYQFDQQTLLYGGSDATLNVSLYPLDVSISGRILRDGAPVAGVTPAVNSSCSLLNAYPSLADGTYAVYGAGGSGCQAELYLPSAAGGNSTSSVVVNTPRGANLTGIDLQLPAATASIGGTVSSIRPAAPVDAPGVILGLSSQITPGEILTLATQLGDSQGGYTFNVAPGTYVLQLGVNDADGDSRASNKLYMSSAAAVVPVNGAATQNFSIRLPVTISGTLSVSGQPLAGVEVYAGCSLDDGSRCTYTTGPSRPDGSFQITGAPGVYDLYPGVSQQAGPMGITRVDASDGGSFSGVAVTAGPKTATIQGTVRDASTNAPMEDMVYLMLPTPDEQGGLVAVQAIPTDDNGQYSVASAAGSFAMYSQPGEYRAQSTSVTATAGATSTANLNLTRFPVTITGSVVSDDGGRFPTGTTILDTSAVGLDGGACARTVLLYNVDTNSFSMHGDACQYDLYVTSGSGLHSNSLVTTFVNATGGGTFSGQTIHSHWSMDKVSGWVTDVYTHRAIPEGVIDFEVPAQTGTDGRVGVAGIWSDGVLMGTTWLASGTYTVVASAPGYVSQTLHNVTVPASGPFSFQLVPNGATSPTATPSTVTSPTATPPPSAATNQRALSTGWNLASYAVQPSSTDVASVLGSGMPLCQWANGATTPPPDCVDVVYGFDPNQGGTTSYFTDPSKAVLNNLSSLQPLQGYWLHTAGPGTWSVMGIAPTAGSQTSLAPGWNLVGWGGADGASVTDALPVCAWPNGASQAPPGCVDVVYGFDPAQSGTTSYFADPSKSVLNNLSTLQTGSGYWLHLTGSQPLPWSPVGGGSSAAARVATPPPTASPTATATATPLPPSPGPSATPTPTSTATASPTPTRTATLPGAETPGASPTLTPTADARATTSVTPTPTAAPEETGTVAATALASVSPTATGAPAPPR